MLTLIYQKYEAAQNANVQHAVAVLNMDQVECCKEIKKSGLYILSANIFLSSSSNSTFLIF